jgi:hypothetical protein
MFHLRLSDKTSRLRPRHDADELAEVRILQTRANTMRHVEAVR